jgi:hypothetical protein
MNFIRELYECVEYRWNNLEKEFYFNIENID